MDFFTKYHQQVRLRVFLALFCIQLITMAGWTLYHFGHLDFNLTFLCIGASNILVLPLLSHFLVRTSSEPLQHVWQAIQHIAPKGDPVPAPRLDDLQLGRELVSSLVNHIYQLASVVADVSKATDKTTGGLHSNFLANMLPLPLIVLDKNQDIVYVNDLAKTYLKLKDDEIEGKSLYATVDMAYADSSQTLQTWLEDIGDSNVTAKKQWDRVRVGARGQKQTKYFDMAAYYNQSNSMGYETLIVLIDHTATYGQDDQAMSFVALSVHELRTPLTLLRGYVEVFDEEVGPTLNPEMRSFMKKMNASAQQLAAFVDNILNVTKIEDDQLSLQLHEEKWQDVLTSTIADLQLRANVRGITIKTDIDPGLPNASVDRYSIYEVIANLVDNAIKYSRNAKEVYVTARLNKEGLIETSVKDFGLGIDANVLPHIFDKFYRNHRNRSQIGGTGLGLYLSRAIVRAHGGEIWVNSKVDEGSTFYFTVLPPDKLDESRKPNSKQHITRSTHGWIKNHSLYRD